MLDWPEREHYTAEDLIEILRILRDPETGCPWDKVQTHQSIRKNFLEETYEALEALDADDPAMLREELGDVLMQVAFHAVMEEERGRFDFEQVCREVCEKLVFRHPNIFASSAAENAGINSWDALKNKEKGRRTLADELGTVPATLPALMYAQKLQKRAAGHGLGAVDQECAAAALRAAEQNWDAAAPEDAAARAGELLFAAVNAIRLAGVDAEEALTFASKRSCDNSCGIRARPSTLAARPPKSELPRRRPNSKPSVSTMPDTSRPLRAAFSRTKPASERRRPFASIRP